QVVEPLADAHGRRMGAIIRARSAIEGLVWFRADSLGDSVTRLTIQVKNITPITSDDVQSRDAALLHAMATTNVVISTSEGQFISLIDPPSHRAEQARECSNVGTWPVLVGEPGDADAMLAAPIILYDYPRIAPQSPGDLF